MMEEILRLIRNSNIVNKLDITKILQTNPVIPLQVICLSQSMDYLESGKTNPLCSHCLTYHGKCSFSTKSIFSVTEKVGKYSNR